MHYNTEYYPGGPHCTAIQALPHGLPQYASPHTVREHLHASCAAPQFADHVRVAHDHQRAGDTEQHHELVDSELDALLSLVAVMEGHVRYVVAVHDGKRFLRAQDNNEQSGTRLNVSAPPILRGGFSYHLMCSCLPVKCLKIFIQPESRTIF